MTALNNRLRALVAMLVIFPIAFVLAFVVGTYQIVREELPDLFTVVGEAYRDTYRAFKDGARYEV
jgi:hypothetical protein